MVPLRVVPDAVRTCYKALFVYFGLWSTLLLYHRSKVLDGSGFGVCDVGGEVLDLRSI